MSEYLHYTESDVYSSLYHRLLKTMEFVLYESNSYQSSTYRYESFTLHDGFYHNIRGPAYIKYYENGVKIYEYYYIKDKFHNTNGPAMITYCENGLILSEEYFINNDSHRIDGPAYIQYNKKGKKILEHYYQNDKRVYPDNEGK